MQNVRWLFSGLEALSTNVSSGGSFATDPLISLSRATSEGLALIVPVRTLRSEGYGEGRGIADGHRFDRRADGLAISGKAGRLYALHECHHAGKCQVDRWWSVLGLPNAMTDCPEIKENPGIQ